MFENELLKVPLNTDLIILPETFTTGFTMNVRENADGEGRTEAWMKKAARETGAVVTGSCIVRIGEQYYNRMLCVDPDGGVEYYDKRHLFRMGREQLYFTPGDRRVIVQIGTFRILLQICYDLRFPVFARNQGDYDAILYVANWPTARQPVWEALLTARAIENQAYVIAGNRCGDDGEGMGTCGLSRVIDPKGNIVAELDDQPGLLQAELDLDQLKRFRENFPVQEDADDFLLRL